jgi:hypothetical protein
MEFINKYIVDKISFTTKKRKIDSIECEEIKKNKFCETSVWTTKVNVKEIQKNEFEVELKFR